MIDWSSLQDAYGEASDVPALLARATEHPDDRRAWDDLWACLCHQGTVYSASYAALAALTDMAAQRTPAGYVESLGLAAAILASTDGPEGSLRRSASADAMVAPGRYQMTSSSAGHGGPSRRT